jgi:hypothetical protein
MDRQDEEFVVKVLKMFEAAHIRNVALETILELHKVPYWKTHADEMAIDPRVQPEIRAAFQRIYASFEHDQRQSESSQCTARTLEASANNRKDSVEIDIGHTPMA